MCQCYQPTSCGGMSNETVRRSTFTNESVHGMTQNSPTTRPLLITNSPYKKLCYRDATCQSNSCQLLHNTVRTTCTKIPEQIEVMQSEGYSRPTYNKLVHSATTRSTVVGGIHKLTVYTRSSAIAEGPRDASCQLKSCQLLLLLLLLFFIPQVV